MQIEKNMINWITNKIAQYVRNKTIDQINVNPSYVVSQHFNQIIPTLEASYGKLQNLFWIGSYKYDLEIIEYFKTLKSLSAETIAKKDANKSTEEENIIDAFVGKNYEGLWLIAFFADNKSDLKKNLVMLDSFYTQLQNEESFMSLGFTKMSVQSQ